MQRRRRLATYLMLAGFLGAGMILLVGFWNYSSATHRIDALVKDCEAIRRSWPWKTAKVPVLSCDPYALEAWKDEATVSTVPIPPGATIGKEHGWVEVPKSELPPEDVAVVTWYEKMKPFTDRITGENDKRERNLSDCWFWVGAIALVCALPRVWYFLLGRLAELASAIRGS
jgi:hypothetical protein